MSNTTKEEIIMSSNDNSITLTSHRLLNKTASGSKEIYLKDIVSHQIIEKRFNYYMALVVIWILASIFLFFLKLQSKSINGQQTDLPILITAIFAVISTYLYFSNNEKILKITGRFNSIDFSLKQLDNQSLNKFLARLEVESENRKNEM